MCGMMYVMFVYYVSVLFSEPKIPQIDVDAELVLDDERFQCSSASRKFLKRNCPTRGESDQQVSVLFSEPKIPQTKMNSANS